jgi:phage-related protein
MQNFKAFFYDKPDGTEPAREFLESLDKKMRAKMVWTIAVLESGGAELKEPYSKHLRGGIFELRAKVGSNISRVLYFFFIGRQAVLTHGFIKKGDNTPPSEIEKAERYRSEYLSRKENQK